MPRRPPHPCTTVGCGALTHAAHCDDHRKDGYARDRARRGTTKQRGYDAPHKLWRLAILNRDPVCVICEKDGRTTPSTVADHIIPLRRGGARFDEANGQGMCSTCHGRKTLAEGSFGRAYIGERGL